MLQDDAIIVLRNGYGSTEHLEEKLQAILFDQQPSLPARSPKDLVAGAWWSAYAAVAMHRWLSLFVVLFAAAGLSHFWSRRWIPRAELATPHADA